MKPQAPLEIRGEFQPIETSAPYIQLCEHLPRLAHWMHRATLVRSMHQMGAPGCRFTRRKRRAYERCA